MPIHVTTTTTQSLSNKTFVGPTRFNSDITIFGNLSCSGTQTFNNTVFSTTSAVSVVHVGSGPALWVGNNGTGDIASFYDIDQNVEVLHVGGNNGSFPNVGVKTSSPNVDFTVNGAISASSIIYSLSGNSNQWNSAYSTVQTTSGSWNPVGKYLPLSGAAMTGNITNFAGDYLTAYSGYTIANNLINIYRGNASGEISTTISPDSISYSNSDGGGSVYVTPPNNGLAINVTWPSYNGNMLTDQSVWPNANSIGWTDAMFYRDEANAIAQRNGTNAQIFRIYNTFTNGSNNERGFIRWNSNVFQIGTERLGAGQTARAISFLTDTVERINIGAAGGITITGSISAPGPTLTGSQATNTLNVSANWNTTGNPALIYGRVANTASGATANLIDVGTTAGGTLFRVGKDGGITAPGPTLTGSQSANTLNLSANWNTTGNPTLIYGRVANTASGATANLIDVGTTAGGTLFRVGKDGGIILGGVQQVITSPSTFSKLIAANWLFANAANPGSQYFYAEPGQITISQANGSLATTLNSAAAATLQLGINAASGVNQTIKACNGTAGAGANLILVGGTGTTTNGGVVVGTNGTPSGLIRHGTATLVSGTVTVSDTNIVAGSRIFVNRQTDGGTIGDSYSITRIAGTSFTITSKTANATATLDTSIVSYLIINP